MPAFPASSFRSRLARSSKLPVGLELDGPAGSDRKLLAVGMAMEKLFGRLPPPSR